MAAILLYLIVCILFGIFTCFWGRKLYFVVLGLLFFLSAFQFCTDKFGTGAAALVLALVIGLIAGFCAKLFYKAGVFLIGLLGGAVIGGIVVLACSISERSMIVLVILLPALLFAFCALHWSDLFIMLSTAFSGASAIAVPACFLCLNALHLSQWVSTDMTATITKLGTYLNDSFTKEHPYLLLAVTLVVGMFGFKHQWNSYRDKDTGTEKEESHKS